ncbi:acyl-CoA:lysophosphatidylglycerol acyltransferase 1-like [Armigeres subalbatus]|uniref:acyl-CoA:lysophosphatidylglycerol acyltransferase 1-like n=1 Tax=Armigeres subalbatus TaxID=124917 RepID=UPI002ED376AB
MPSCSGLIEVIKYPRALFRTVFVIVNNIYCVPTYLVWMFLLLPLKKINESCYFKIEGILFHWLLANVSMWSSSAGYDLVELGDDISPAMDERTLVIANHQSTSDVPLLMAAFNVKKGVLPNIMWIMDRMFKYTNFGAVSLLHQDFFIASGKSNREKSLLELKSHLRKSYIPRQRKWMMLFPEGGFLRKRKEVSQRFAEKNNLPTLNHVTVPRVGAMKTIVDVLGSLDSPCLEEDKIMNNSGYVDNTMSIVTDGFDSSLINVDHQQQQQQQHQPKQYDVTNNSSSTIINSEAINTDDCDSFKDSPLTKLNGKMNDCLEYILDITIGYPNGKPLDLPNIVHGLRNPCQTYLFYRLYRSSEVPRDSESLTQWLYDRFIEKEKLLDEFYRTGMFPCGSSSMLPTVIQQDLLRFLLIHLFFITSTYVHYQLILMLINYSNVMYVYLLNDS